MPLQWSKAYIPMERGAEQGADSRVRRPDSIDVTNMYWDKRGALVKRPGFSVSSQSAYEYDGSTKRSISLFTNGSNATGKCRKLASTGTELLAVCEENVLKLDQQGDGTNDAWLAKDGHHAPFTFDRTTVFDSTYSIVQSDCVYADTSQIGAAYDGLVYHVALVCSYEGTASSGPHTAYYGVIYRVDDADGSNVIPTRWLVVPTSTSTAIPSGVRIVCTNRTSAADPYIVLGIQKDISNGDLDLYTFPADEPETMDSSATPNAVFSLTGQLDVAPNGPLTGTPVVGNRMFDLCVATDLDNFVTLAYVEAVTNDIELKTFSPTGISYSSTATITSAGGTAQQVALAYDETNDEFCVVYWDSVDGDIDAEIYNTSLTKQHGPSEVANAVNDIRSLGACPNDDNTRWAFVWTEFSSTDVDTQVRDPQGVTTWNTLSQDLSTANGENKLYNFATTTQPFYAPGTTLLYIAGFTLSGAKPGWDSWCIMRVEDGTAKPDPKVAAVLIPSLAPRLGGTNNDTGEGVTDPGDCIPSWCGTCGGVSSDPDGNKYFDAPFITFNIEQRAYLEQGPLLLENAGSDISERYGCEHIKLTMGGSYDVISPARGAALIGGAAIDWYDGARVFEIGYVAPPVADVDTAANADESNLAAAPQLQNATDYTWAAHWEYGDNLGIIHRSAPFVFPTDYQLSSGSSNDAIDIDYRTLGATSKGDDCSVSVYRNTDDGSISDTVLRRAHGALQLIPNNINGPKTIEFRDRGQINSTASPALYVESGELEPSPVEGARIMAAVGERIWVARRDQIFYSKKITPQGNVRYAPEFHESQVYSLDDGRECTGLAALDEKVVVFTRDRVYVVAGDGPDITGANNDLSGPIAISSDTGCVDHRSVVVTPMGVMFQGVAGIYLLGRDHKVVFIGEPVEDDTDSYSTITSGVLCPKYNQVRFTCNDGTDSIILVYDYSTGQWVKWGTFSGQVIVSACVHNDVYYYAEEGQVWYETPSDSRDLNTGSSYSYVGATISTGWIVPSDGSPQGGPAPAGWQRIRRILPMMSKADDHALTIKVYHDWSSTATDTFTLTAAQIAAMSTTDDMLVNLRTSRQKCRAIKIEISDALDSTDTAAGLTDGKGFEITGIQLEIGQKRGLAKLESGKRI